ncbi:hypothetical protein FD755_008185 [Muntiacus reevesi]|uniref:TFIIS-type domain-containing protein n=1 Tax=Muntiacus reevesi TaxID=9886 RepID=A0A5J5MM79_MUNRE|nr:hypothetical protein FD755_008185 [Muntiacus reevesi]
MQRAPSTQQGDKSANCETGWAAAGAAGSVRPVVATLRFCPGCRNGLIAKDRQRCHRFAGNTCPYSEVSKAEVDDVLGGETAWESCEHPRAYFLQLQTRSAGEPVTTFHECCNAQCGHRWRD